MEGVQNAICNRLTADLPVELAAVRTRMALDTRDLPDPGVYPFQRKLATADFPVVWVMELLMERSVESQRLNIGTLMSSRYALSVMSWVRQTDWAAAGANRARLVQALHTVLIRRPRLFEQGPEHITVDVSSVVADYSVTDEDSRQTFAACNLQLTCDVDEILLPVPDPAYPGGPATVAAQVYLMAKLPTSNPPAP